MTPPPPVFWVQFMNFWPFTEMTPWGVCHFALSWRSLEHPKCWSSVPRSMVLTLFALLLISSNVLLRIKPGPQAFTISHVNYMAVLCQSINQGSGQLRIFKERIPLIKSKIGGDQGCFFLVSFVHQGKKQTDLYRVYFYKPQFIYQQAIVGCKGLHHFLLCMIGNGLVKHLHKFREQYKLSSVSPVYCPGKKSRCKACLSSACGTYSNNILLLWHVI